MHFLALIDFLSGWWDGLNVARQIFYGIGILAGLVTLTLALLSFVGLDHGDAVGVDADGGAGIFSVRPLTGFFLGFGWVGGLTLHAGASLPVALLAASVAGGSIMSGVVLMFRFMLSLRSDGTVRLQDTVGAVGTVYVTLPPSRASGGQVTVSFSGRQETMPALNTSDRTLASGEKVKVVQLVDSRTLLVEPLG